MNKTMLMIGSIAAALVIFVAINISSQGLLPRARVDMTENQLFTLTEGSRSVVGKVPEPITLTLYYSASVSNSVPQVKPYAIRVREMLQEFALASKGKIVLKEVDPEPFSEAEDDAVAAGLIGQIADTAGSKFYHGLVGTNSTDASETIRVFDSRREAFLEHDIAKLVYLLSDPPKSTVGLMSWLPMEGMEANPFTGQQGGTPPWQVVSQLKQFTDLKTIANDATEIPTEVKVLIIVHPKDMSQPTQYAVDQFVLRGGRLIVCVDPHCELDTPPGVNPMQAFGIPKNSNLNTLFDAWGLEMVDQKFAGDQDAAIEVNMGGDARPEAGKYLAWVRMTADNINRDDPVTSTIETVLMASSGILQQKAGATTAFQPLIQTSANSMAIDTSKINFMPDPKTLLAEFASGNKPLVLAARVTGSVKTAFAAGKPVASAAADGADPAAGPAITMVEDPAQLKESKDSINIIVVADCDMLADRFWVNEARFGQLVLGYQKFADNGDFIIGAMDNLSGSSDLISLRARSGFQRAFKVVDNLKKDAELKYLSEQQTLRRKLDEAERQLQEIQNQRADGGDSAMLLTPEQQATIARFRQEQLTTRKELRRVQLNLDKDIAALGTTLKVINIALVPVLVALFALVLALVRANARTADRTRSLARS